MAAPASAREAALHAKIDALRRALAQQRAVPADSHSPIWHVCRDLLGVTDEQGAWLEVNPAWTTVLGWPAAQILGRTSGWLVHPDDARRSAWRRARAAKVSKSACAPVTAITA
jgi:PAS domain-containing protein